MSGNVWEWTRSLWGGILLEPDFGYPYEPGKDREELEGGPGFLVLRGGAFDLDPEYVRCACRVSNYDPEADYFVAAGFRVVVSPFFSGR